jgi:hypothetical protein
LNIGDDITRPVLSERPVWDPLEPKQAPGQPELARCEGASNTVYELPNERTKRMDAILSNSSPERMEWEISLLAYIKNGVEYDDEISRGKYSRRFIVEGVNFKD